MKTAMRAKDAARLSTIRLLLAAIKQREVDERIELDRRRLLAIIEKMIKQRRDSIPSSSPAGARTWPTGGRAELGLLAAYLPQHLTDAEIAALSSPPRSRDRAPRAGRTWAR